MAPSDSSSCPGVLGDVTTHDIVPVCGPGCRSFVGKWRADPPYVRVSTASCIERPPGCWWCIRWAFRHDHSDRMPSMGCTDGGYHWRHPPCLRRSTSCIMFVCVCNGACIARPPSAASVSSLGLCTLCLETSCRRVCPSPGTQPALTMIATCPQAPPPRPSSWFWKGRMAATYRHA